jgi:hypothetical protein
MAQRGVQEQQHGRLIDRLAVDRVRGEACLQPERALLHCNRRRRRYRESSAETASERVGGGQGVEGAGGTGAYDEQRW